jgi:beta-glucanase (GH16 family)
MTGRPRIPLALAVAAVLAVAAPASPAPGEDGPRGPAVAAAQRGPSGVAPPARAPSGWRRVLTENFARIDPERWQLYDGVPGGDPFGLFASSHVAASNGVVVIDGFADPALGGAWATGGIATRPRLYRRYGRYLVRMRFSGGTGVAHTALLVPADGTWPPEIDFSEDNGRGAQRDYATLHHGPDNIQVQDDIRVDLTKWHTLGVAWRPGRLDFLLDGRVWSRIRSRNVPSAAMKLAIQTQAWGCGINDWEACVDTTTPAHVRLFVDWVTIDAHVRR